MHSPSFHSAKEERVNTSELLQCPAVPSEAQSFIIECLFYSVGKKKKKGSIVLLICILKNFGILEISMDQRQYNVDLIIRKINEKKLFISNLFGFEKLE